MSKKFNLSTRKRAIAALSIALSAMFSLGMLSACGGEETVTPEEETPVSTATDTQLLKNGNFEFYDERDTKLEDKRTFISTPTSWSFSSGSPSSNTRSGLIITESKEYDQITKTGGYPFAMFTHGEESVSTFQSIEEAYTHWEDENVSVYDRLKFLDIFKSEIDDLAEGTAEKELFDKYSYSIDFEDVENFGKDFQGNNALKPHEGAAEGETGLLMIHNQRTSDGVMGTAQYYTSSTTITLEAGSAAEVSVWVRTDKLYHYYEPEKDDSGNLKEKEEIQKRGGAYIGIINTLGGNTQDEMQIKNIRTGSKWQQYTVYIRANTYATTTFRIKLGLGQGTSSDNRYEAVDGYAFFDDVTVKKVSAEQYAEDTKELTDDVKCDLNSTADDKIFDQDKEELKVNGVVQAKYALDLYGDNTYTTLNIEPDIALTKETSGSSTYESFIGDNRADTDVPANKKSVVGVQSYTDLETLSTTNDYFKNIFESDFKNDDTDVKKDKFPFDADAKVLLLLSTNGAAYTAEVTSNAFSLAKDEYMLISFFVKTSAMRSGISGAGITLVDGENETAISPFDTTTVDPVTIDDSNEELTDIYKGWVQCFFFVSNTAGEDGDPAKTFSLKFTYGPTAVAGTKEDSYCEGYAAFANFQIIQPAKENNKGFTKAQYGYASTGNYAKKVELTEYTKDTSKFTDAEASSNIKEGLAKPASFREVLAGSKVFDSNSEIENARPDDVYAGLLNSEYAGNYLGHDSTDEGYGWLATLNPKNIAKENASSWWNGLFGDQNNTAYPNRQPFVLVNASSEEARPSYGIVSSSMQTTISAGSAQRITLRVKVQKDTTAYIYLLDTSDLGKGFNTLLTPSLPQYTYWYDADGNVVKSDPTEKGFKKKTDTLFYLETNGLYTRADKADGNYYANLKNYDVEDGNLVTSDGQIAFYGQEENGKTVYYAYRTADSANKKNYVYSQRVYDFTEAEGLNAQSYLRYDESATDFSKYASCIEIKGSTATETSWTTVSFYVRAGSEAKTYRLELWAGARDNATNGFPAGGYVFFDAFNSASSSNFEGLRDEAVDALLENETNQLEGDSEKVKEDLALYYTFTFYDSKDFLRHDRTLDEVDLGSKWGSYDQTSKEEQLMWLKYQEAGAVSVFLDFSAAETAVTPDSLDADTDTDTTTDETEETSNTNIWLVLSSSLLAFVTLFAIGAVVFRAVRKRSRKNGPKPPKAKKTRPAPAAPEKPEGKKGIDPYDE